ncbi:piggyBac transposable element-derived protein 4-like [Oscarella lobularis]|uniref:piggyBac transposable element-derived protein 4-like n=1 Tax=Oscarella lobularis TaxID=121494 RepID=UPI003313BFFA
MKAFLGLIIFMGILRFPSLTDYWQTFGQYLKNNLSPIFPKTKFKQISRFLHVSNITTELPRRAPGYDKLQKIRPLIEHCTLKFKRNFNLSKCITVDEAMIFKGRWSIKQYMKDKPHKWGVKLFVLADAETGYVWNFFIYTGKSTAENDGPSVGICTRAVLDLVKECHHKGHVLYTDNYYTSPDLFMTLYSYDIYAKELRESTVSDTLKKRKRGTIQRLEERLGTFTSMRRRPTGVPGTVQRREGACTMDVQCPPYLPDYIKKHGGVDRGDQILSL